MRVKRIFTGATAVTMAAALAACSGGSNDGAQQDAPESVMIGGLWAMSGPAAIYGDWYTNASQLAVKQINEDGGLNGQTKIDLQIEDTQALAEPAVIAFQHMLGDDVQMALTSFSSQTLAVMPIANQNKIPMFNGGAQSTQLGETGDFLYNTIPLIQQESEVLAKYLHDEGNTKAAIIYTSDDSGTSAYKNFKESYQADGGEVVAEKSAEFQGTDYRSQLTILKQTDADVLVIAAFGEDSNNIISQAREIGWDIQLANTSWVTAPVVMENPAAEGLIHTDIPFDPSDEFVEAYKAEYGKEPDSAFIGNYFDAVKVWAEAYEYASDDGSKVPSGPEVIEAIHEIGTFESSYGSKLSFDENGLVQRPISVAQITDGASVVLEETYDD